MGCEAKRGVEDLMTWEKTGQTYRDGTEVRWEDIVYLLT